MFLTNIDILFDKYINIILFPQIFVLTDCDNIRVQLRHSCCMSHIIFRVISIHSIHIINDCDMRT